MSGPLSKILSPAEAMQTALTTTGWVSQSNSSLAYTIKQPLLSLCARYGMFMESLSFQRLFRPKQQMYVHVPWFTCTVLCVKTSLF